MAVRLRLMRMGKKKQPTYRIVAADSRSPRDGRFLEIVGTYQPRLEPSGIKIDDEKALKWLRHGAQPSETVEKLMKIAGTWDIFKGNAPEPAAAEEPDSTEASELSDSVDPADSESESADVETVEAAT